MAQRLDVDSAERLSELWRRRVIVYWKPLSRNLRPSKLMPKMRLSSTDSADVDEIYQKDSENMCIAAAEKLLEYLLNKGDLDDDSYDARWSLFDKALEESHPWLHDVVSGRCEAEDAQNQSVLVNFFTEEICHSVDPEVLLPSLLSRRLLGEVESEVLVRILREKGPTLAAVYMVGHLHRSPNPCWYRDFLTILDENGYGHVAEHLDTVEYNKILAERRKRSLRSSRTESTLTVRGGPHTSTANVNCPPPVGETDHGATKDLKLYPSKVLAVDEQSCKTWPSDSDNNNLDTTDAKQLDSFTEEKILNVNTEENVNHPEQQPDASPVLDACDGAWSLPPNISSNREADDGSDEDSESMTTSSEETLSPLGPEQEDCQQDIARTAMYGRDIVITAPTNRYKTQIALNIIDSHFKQEGDKSRKVVYMANQARHAESKFRHFEKNLRNFSCQKYIANMEKVHLSQLLSGDVLVVTGQMLMDALNKSEIDICHFSLIIFDECNIIGKTHPFKVIIRRYMDIKNSCDGHRSSDLPQLVCLTQSKAVSLDTTEESVKMLCLYLDANFICNGQTDGERLILPAKDKEKLTTNACDMKTLANSKVKTPTPPPSVKAKITTQPRKVAKVTAHSKDTKVTAHSKDTKVTAHSKDTKVTAHSKDTKVTAHSKDTSSVAGAASGGTLSAELKAKFDKWAATLASRTQADYYRYLDSYVKYCQTHSLQPVSISEQALARYATQLKGKPDTVRKYLLVVKKLYKCSELSYPYKDSQLIEAAIQGSGK